MDINVCGLFIYSIYTVEALVSGHPRVAKMVPITVAGRLRECENTELVSESRKTGFCEDGRKKSCFPLTRVSVRRAYTCRSLRSRDIFPSPGGSDGRNEHQ